MNAEDDVAFVYIGKQFEKNYNCKTKFGDDLIYCGCFAQNSYERKIVAFIEIISVFEWNFNNFSYRK